MFGSATRRPWLKSFGDEVAITGSPAMRNKFLEIAENMANYYANI